MEPPPFLSSPARTPSLGSTNNSFLGSQTLEGLEAVDSESDSDVSEDSSSSDFERDEQIQAEKVAARLAEEERLNRLVVLDPSVPVLDKGVTASNLEDALALLRENKLDTVIVAGEDLFKAGGRSIGEALSANTAVERLQITTLSLPHNDLGDDGLAYIVDALRNNVQLRTLILDHCNLTKKGAASVAELLSSNTALTRFNINANNVEEAGAASLADALMNNKDLRVLALSGNEIGGEGARCISKLLEENNRLEELELAENQIGDDGLEILVRGLVRNPALRRLDLSGNLIGEPGARFFASVLPFIRSLEELDLSCNDFTGDSDAILASAFTNNSSVRKLNLSTCKLDDDGAFAFADMLEKNTTLSEVDLRGNYISPDGLHRLTSVMKVNTTMLSLQVFEAEARSQTQALLNRFCRRNGVEKQVRKPRSRVTDADMAAQVNWGTEMVVNWADKIGVHQAIGPFEEHQVDGSRLMALTLGEMKKMGVEPFAARREVMDQLGLLKTNLELNIRKLRGEAPHPEEEDDEELLRKYQPPEKLTHTQQLRHQRDRNMMGSPLSDLKAKLERGVQEDELETAARRERSKAEGVFDHPLVEGLTPKARPPRVASKRGYGDPLTPLHALPTTSSGGNE